MADQPSPHSNPVPLPLLIRVRSAILSSACFSRLAAILSFAVLMICLTLAAFHSPLQKLLAPLVPVYTFAETWMAATGLVFLLILLAVLFYRRKTRLAVAPYNWKIFSFTLLILSAISAAGVHWTILVFQLRLFKALPGWFWKFQFKPAEGGLWILFVLIACLWLVLRLVLSGKISAPVKLAVLVLVAYALQIGFGFLVSPDGYGAITQKYSQSMHNRYALFACDNPDFFYSLSHYDEIYGRDIFLGTKPPGVLGIYMLAQKASNWFSPVADFGGQFNRLTGFITYVFPLVSLLIIPLLWGFTRAVTGRAETGFLASVLVLSAPNFVLMPLFLDQVLYPSLFISCLWMFYGAYRSQKNWLFLVCGIFQFFVAGFISFSLLPVIAMCFVWLFLLYLEAGDFRQIFRRFVINSVWFAGGLILAYFLLNWVLNYDAISRYQNAFLIHRSIKQFSNDPLTLLLSMLLNLVDFSSWTGFPLILTSLFFIVGATRNLFCGKISGPETLAIATTVMAGGILLFGQTRGETGRLWLFLLPAVSLFSAAVFSVDFKSRLKWFWVLAGLQIITVFLIQRFQDFFA